MRRSIAQNKVFLIIYTIIAIAAYAAIALLIMYLVSHSGLYPSGSDTMYHIYRGELLYESIGKGNWYPLYDPNWYNGVEIMRYWAPMCPYFYVLCELIAGLFVTNAFGGYIVFCGMVFFLGAIVWHIIGLVMRRPFMGSVMALLWFIMPNNLYAMFGEGNLARSVSLIFLPLYVFAIYQYLNTGKVRYLPTMTITFLVIASCHVGYAGMVALSLLVFLVIDMITFKRYVKEFRVLLSTLFGYAMTGLYLIPSLIGGVSSVHTTENAKGFFQDILISVNPLYRVQYGLTTWYFGLAAALIALLGAIVSYRRSRPGFWLGLITLILTADVMYDAVMLLPLSSWLWMLRFISIALCFILMSFMEWRTLRKPIMLFMVLLLIADTIPSLYFIYGERNNYQPEQEYASYGKATLLERAKEVTKQRLAVLDEGRLGSKGAYYPVMGPNGVKTTFGAGREAAETNKNIVNLNKGLVAEAYIYTFDRAMEMGNDAVLLVLSDDEAKHVKEMDTCAKKVGYDLDSQIGKNRLYTLSKEHPQEWGVVSKFKAIAIGDGSEVIARQYPYFKEGGSNILDDYTVDDLKQYQIVYLTSFEFKNREYAENLVVQLGEAGTKVIISADGVPEDRAANGKVFLGVLCNGISFSQGYPLLETIEGTLDTDLFPSEYREWNTCFCDGLDQVWGVVKDEKYDIPFLGTVKNDNIIFIGLNLTNYYGMTRDASVERLLSSIMSLSTQDLPERTIVPIDIRYEADKITISSDYDNVNTTLAYHNFFGLDKAQYEDNHLLYVPKGVTEIQLKYPYFVQGLLCTVGAALLALIYHVVIHIMNRRSRRMAALGPKAAEAVPQEGAVEDEVVRDSFDRMTEEEFERANAAYSFFNEGTKEGELEDTEFEDYGTGIKFEEVDVENNYYYDDVDENDDEYYHEDDVYYSDDNEYYDEDDDVDSDADDYKHEDKNIKE